MKVITLANEKGGVGKTTIATTIAAGLALRGQRVVLIDADGQANATYMLGLKPQPAFYDLLVRDGTWRDLLKVVRPESYAPVGMSGREIEKGLLAVLPGNGETQLIQNRIDDAFLLDDRLRELETHVDVVIFDTSPTPSLLHGVIYLATDALIYVTQCETLSVRGLIATLGNLEGFRRQRMNARQRGIQVAGIVPNRYRKNTVEHDGNLADLRKHYGESVWQPVADRIVWAEASKARRPVFAHDPHSAAAKDAWTLVEQVLGVTTHVQA